MQGSGQDAALCPWDRQGQWVMPSSATSGPGGSILAPCTYRLATFAYHTASSEGRHLDVGFKLHFFFWVKEVFLFQLPKYPPLGLERRHKGSKALQ